MPTYLDILQNSQQHTAQVMGLASQQLQATAQLNHQKEAFNANFALQKEEAAARSRAYQTQASAALVRNKLAADKFQMEKDLMPVKIKEANLKLKAAEADLKRESFKESSAAFDNITKPFDTIVSGNFAANRSPEYAEKYFGIKAGHRISMENGDAFNPDEFKRQVEELNTEFDGVKNESEEYDPEVSFYYKQLGDTAAATRYETDTNPKLTPSMPGIMSRYLTGSDAEATKVMEENKNSFTNEGVVSLTMGREALKSMEFDTEYLGNTRAAIDAQLIGLSPDDPSYPELKAAKTETGIKFAQSVLDRQSFLKSMVSGEPIPQPEKEPAPENQGKKDYQAVANGTRAEVQDLFSSTDNSKDNTFETQFNKIGQGFTMEFKRPDPVNESGFTSVTVNPLEGLDTAILTAGNEQGFMKSFDRFSLAPPQQSPTTTNVIRRTVTRNLDTLDNDELLSLMHQPIISEIIEKKKIRVNSVQGNKSFSVGTSSIPRKSRREGDNQIEVIQSVKDLMSVVEGKGSGMSEADKRRNLLDVYSAIIAAGIEQSAIENEK